MPVSTPSIAFALPPPDVAGPTPSPDKQIGDEDSMLLFEPNSLLTGHKHIGT
jgi:hypothetical protein